MTRGGLQVITVENEAAVYACAQQLFAGLFELPDTPYLVLLSGGSSLRILSAPWGTISAEYCTLGVLDERWSADPAVSNWQQIIATPWHRSAVANGAKNLSFPIPGELSLEQATKQYEQTLRSWRAAHPTGKIIITLGLGADGHTAGILPLPGNPEQFKRQFADDTCWVAGHRALNAPACVERVTVTVPFLLTQVVAGVAVVVGAAKEGAMHALLAPTGNLAATPGRVMLKMPQVLLVTDQTIETESDCCL